MAFALVLFSSCPSFQTSLGPSAPAGLRHQAPPCVQMNYKGGDFLKDAEARREARLAAAANQRRGAQMGRASWQQVSAANAAGAQSTQTPDPSHQLGSDLHDWGASKYTARPPAGSQWRRQAGSPVAAWRRQPRQSPQRQQNTGVERWASSGFSGTQAQASVGSDDLGIASQRRTIAEPSGSLKQNIADAEARALQLQQRTMAPPAHARSSGSLKQKIAEAEAHAFEQARAAAEARAAEEQLRKEQAAAALAESLRQQLAVAEARAAAAEEQAAAAAAAAEVAEAAGTASVGAASGEHAEDDDAAAESKATPSPSPKQPRDAYLPWLARLAEGELEPLGDVEVLAALTEAGMAARAATETLDDAAEKRAWLKKLDVPLWGKAAIALSEAASEAAEMAEQVAMCEAGDAVECRIVAEKTDETSLVLHKLNVEDWGAAAAVLSAAAWDMAAVASAAFAALEVFGFRMRHSRGDQRPE